MLQLSIFYYLLSVIPLIYCSTFLDNEIVGAPEIQCNPDRIVFSFNTRRPFKGNVYIRGYYDRESCRRRFEAPGVQGGSLTIRLGDCGMTRMRQLVPLGVSVHVTFVANFHPLFSTKEDRAFNVRCFYAHAETVVKADMDVNASPAESLEQATSLMPDCKYTLREREYNGQISRTTNLGAPIFHQWDCAANGNYGILIKSCSVVDNRNAKSIPIIDDKGCPIGEFPQIVYSASLTSAYAVIEALSFPDEDSISFACQIKLCDKTADECRGISPPMCTNVQPVVRNINDLVELDNTILDTLGGTAEEPWMKEPSPPIEDGENSTTILNIIDEVTRPTRFTEEEWAVESNNVDRNEKRGKRLATIREIDVQTDKLFVNSALLNPLDENRSDESPCVSLETLWLSLSAIGFLFIILTGIVIYIASHFMKRKKETEDSKSASTTNDYCYINKF